MAREGLIDNKGLKVVSNLATWLSGGSTFWAEEIASAKAPRNAESMQWRKSSERLKLHAQRMQSER